MMTWQPLTIVTEGWETISGNFRDRVILLVQGPNPGVIVLTGN
jgi:hypothetical protein